MSEKIRFNYGGGRQTVAMCIMIAKGVLPRPDIIVMADTGRENPMTWDYLETYTQPLMEAIGLEIQVAPHSLATVDLHAHNGDLLLPVYTQTGKLSPFCSGEWKRDVCERYARNKGINRGISWLGLGFDERRRWSRSRGTVRHNWTTECPLVDRQITTAMCLHIIENFGWPQPHVSSCWMCPHKQNHEWRYIRDNHPELWRKAIEIDEEERAADHHLGS